MKVDMMTRRSFVSGSSAAAVAAACGLPAFGASERKPFGGYGWGALLHLGANMWGDFPGDPDKLPTSAEAEAKSPVLTPGGKPVRYHNYLRCEDDLWRLSTDRMAARKMDFVFIDLGEGVAYPSHPELAVPGSWSVEKLRGELARLRASGLEPLPKLNFSACHDSWLKDYHRQLSTRRYYQVVADLIADVCEIFGTPRLFHLGYDEEMPIAQADNFQMICRQGDQWWHDLLHAVGEVERHGSRAVVWSDAMWTGRAEFLRRMPKSVLQSNWYYRADFSPRKLQWNAEFEKKGGWGETVNGAAAFLELEKAGFDQLPCTSNYFEDGASDPFVGFCLENIDPSRLKGLYMAPWARTLPDEKDHKQISRTLAGIDEFASARDKRGERVEGER